MGSPLRRARKRNRAGVLRRYGRPCLYKGGYAACKRRFDESGNKTGAAFFGVDGKPCLSDEGLARWEARYDAETRSGWPASVSTESLA